MRPKNNDPKKERKVALIGWCILALVGLPFCFTHPIVKDMYMGMFGVLVLFCLMWLVGQRRFRKYGKNWKGEVESLLSERPDGVSFNSLYRHLKGNYKMKRFDRDSFFENLSYRNDIEMFTKQIKGKYYTYYRFI